MIDLGEKIFSVRKAAGMSRKAFAQRIGIGESKVQNVETGHQRADHEFLEKVIKAFELDANWLLDSELGMEDVAVNSKEFIPIPRYDVELSAGDGTMPVDAAATGFYGFKREWLSRHGLNPNVLSVVVVAGDSMMPYLSHGDLVLIDHGQAEIMDGRTFAVRYDDQVFVKKVQLAPGKVLHLVSANSEYSPITIDLTDEANRITIIGRVVASMHEWI